MDGGADAEADQRRAPKAKVAGPSQSKYERARRCGRQQTNASSGPWKSEEGNADSGSDDSEDVDCGRRHDG